MLDSHLGLAVVFNGAIYNYRQLRDELRAQGYRFASVSDTEVVLKAYHYWGREFVGHLDGMFAVAIAELQSGALVLARDPVGIKPLYVSEVNGTTRFASTLPALVASAGVDTTLDKVALHHYLSWHSVVPGPRTLVSGVRRVTPGAVIFIAADGQATTWPGNRPQFKRRVECRDYTKEDWATEIRSAVRSAVTRQVPSDTGAGVWLSGGLDSSLVVACMAEGSANKVRTFSIGFESSDGIAGDEFPYSDLIVRHFETDHQQIVIHDRDLPGAILGAVAGMSEPIASHDAVAFYLLAEHLSKSARVALSGQGADEVFAGYRRHQRYGSASGSGLEAYAESFDRTHSEILSAVHPTFALRSDPSHDVASSYFETTADKTVLDKVMQLGFEVTLVEDPLKRVDNMSMAWGVEARVPFLDRTVVGLGAACPPELKLADHGKGILKEAARGVVPSEIVTRPKGDFAVPPLMRLRGPLLDMAREAVLADGARTREIFRPEYVQWLIESEARTPLGDSKLWQVAVLELWLQAVKV